MANIALTTAGRVEVVESLEQMTLLAAEDTTAGAPVRIDTDGKFTNSNASSTTEARTYGIATRTVKAGMPLTALHRGVMDGFALSGLAYDAAVSLSDTDGRVADATGTVNVTIGRVVPGTATTLGTSPDKLLLVEVENAEDIALDSLAVASADALTVNGVIVPQAAEVSVSIPLHATKTEYNLFVARDAWQVTHIDYTPDIAQGGALTATVVKASGTATPAFGTTPMHTANAINLNGTAHTVQPISLTATTADLQLAAGDRIGLDLSGAMTTGSGLVTVRMERI